MLYPTDSDWKKWQIDALAHRFFTLRWIEILDSSTFGTWRIRTANIRSILVEMAESASICTQIPSHHANLKALLDETALILKHDDIVRNHKPILKRHLIRLNELYSNKIKSGNNPQTEQFIRLCHIALSELFDYATLAFDEIQILLFSNDFREKHTLSQLAMLLALDLKNSGFSIDYLSTTSKALLNPALGDFSARFRKLREAVSAESMSFLCHLLVRGVADISLTQHGEIMSADLDQINPDLVANLTQQDPEGVIVACQVEARDPNQAAFMAKRIIEDQLAIRRLYFPQKHLNIHQNVLITDKVTQQSLLVSVSSAGPKTPPKASDIDQKAADLAATVARLRSDDKSLFRAALQYYRLMLQATTDEARMINLWIALEALFQTTESDTIIGRITSHVPTIMALTYVSDILRALSKDLRVWWKQTDTDSIRTFFRRSKEYFIHPFDLALLLTASDDSPEFKAFNALVSTNPLMVYRIYKLRNGLFKSPIDMNKRIEEHKANVDWQLRRIYRLRNTITHQGRVSKNVVQLIEHLQEYFISTIHDLIHTLRLRPVLSIPEALESRGQDLLHMLSRLDENGGAQISIQFLCSGYPSTEQNSSTAMWSVGHSPQSLEA